jgi:hypothetical protein
VREYPGRGVKLWAWSGVAAWCGSAAGLIEARSPIRVPI